VAIVVVGLAAVATAYTWLAPKRDGTVVMNHTVKPDESPPWFEESADAAGIDFTYIRGLEINYWFPEIMGGGAAWLDYDSDGYLDLYLVQGGQIGASGQHLPGNRLYRNRGDGTFEDVTESAGVGDRGYGMGCACGDYDNDGDVDIYVTNVGPNLLYRNNGDGTFTDVTATAGAGDPSWSTSAAFVDYDRDGDLDLFVANYVNWSVEREQVCFGIHRDYCAPTAYDAPAPDTLYRNEGNGTFLEVSESAGLRAAFGNGLGVVCGDFNLDGYLDIYLANDQTPSQMWINDGHGHFTDQALLAGCAVDLHGTALAGMGVQAFDMEGDGDLDLFKTHLREESNTFYLNRGGVFEDTTQLTGLAAPSIPFTGFGMGFADFDHDGNTDLYVANGRVGNYEPRFSETDVYGEPNQLYRGLGDGRFVEVMPRGGTREQFIGASRAAAFADYDNDGDIDVAVVNSGSKAHLFRNVVAKKGNWIMFRVRDEHGRDVPAAMVQLEAAGKVQWRLADPAYSYCASNDSRVLFGLGDAVEADHVTVRWPDGRLEQFGPFPAGEVHVLERGSGDQ
jgi:hypothetical protein